ncbi:hypothetical protein B0H14DRAFT_3148919 [Mycena olivaceomarginata]|nr:hypothetical protein B0H14DRAFT_3148919 [Mycena olivaceomarginata]
MRDPSPAPEAWRGPPCAQIERRAVSPCLPAEVACGARPHSQATPLSLLLTALLVHRVDPLRHADNPNSSLSDLEQQDLVLCEYLQALLAPHGRHLHASSPTRTSTGIEPPACAPSVLFSWSESVDTTSLPLSTPTPPPALRFIHHACTLQRARERRQQRRGAGDVRAGGDAAAAPAGRQGSDGRGYEQAFVPRASKLRVAS